MSAKRIVAAICLAFALGAALAAASPVETILKPPALQQFAPPLPHRPDGGDADEQVFYLIPASALARVSEIISNMLREIQRLEAIVNKRSCN